MTNSCGRGLTAGFGAISAPVKWEFDFAANGIPVN
jgi:hypothetical protein